MLLKSTHIFVGGCFLSGALLLQKGRITAIYPEDSKLPQDEEFLDYGDRRILPGLFDIHTHGYRGWAARAGTQAAIEGFSMAIASAGVTSFLPTVGEHCPQEKQILQAIAAARNFHKGANVLGAHMEGPFLNPKRHGGFFPEQFLAPSVTDAAALLDAADGAVRYMTFSPELDGADALQRYLQCRGVIVSAGHTDATAAEMQRAIACGLQASTHTGNAMRQIDRRDIGALGAALLDKNLYNEIICDFVHLSPEMLRLMFQLKGSMDRFIVVSDSDEISGQAPGTYRIDGVMYRLTPEGAILLEDGTLFGSCKDVLFGLKNLVEALHVPFADALAACTIHPAQLLGCSEHKGTLQPGKDADLVVLEDDYIVAATYVMGRCVYRKGMPLPENQDFLRRCRSLGKEE
ncbi:MAG: N-acetylglucosamine-6-phosphate deacetylase [Faecalibacterium sp.]|jgi:N-acetylglucosamine-6-phosphate deacetylase|nr:N-acetylglucosamine-6-phosphate deacetylase [Faecalibacterium sp.]